MASMIELIKELRDRTGAGMMDCKKALEASNQDVEKAIDWLREKGIAKAQAKASRIAAEGVASVLVDGDKAVIAEINCETDFVSKGDKFHKLVSDVVEVTLKSEPKDIDEAKELTKALFTDATVSMGEKLDYRRFEIVKKQAHRFSAGRRREISLEMHPCGRLPRRNGRYRFRWHQAFPGYPHWPFRRRTQDPHRRYRRIWSRFRDRPSESRMLSQVSGWSVLRCSYQRRERTSILTS